MMRPLLIALAIFAVACRTPAEVTPQSSILILISIDGFRWDYLDRYAPPNIRALAERGVRAEGLIPQFPSKTFPNHYTVVTGLRLANHGIISNNMRDPEIPGEFSLSNREVQADPRWWGGEPIWNTAERQGRVAAAMFWPGSETVIGGRQATYWTKYDDDLPHETRVERLLSWLKLPEGKRPSFMTLYYSDVDSAGHDDGPESDAVREALAAVDRSIGQLVQGVDALDLEDRVNYVLVSDHGMAALSRDRMIVLDELIDLDPDEVIDWAPVLGMTPKDGNVDALYSALNDKHPHLAVYRREQLPPEYGLGWHARLPAVIGIADEGWYITSRREVARWGTPGRGAPGGTHGYDARVKSMQGLFIASGPRFRSNVLVRPFENIHIYELMCAVLGLVPAKNDGDPAVTRDMLR
jgi:predicted AlkP superfamily pyrophosphatase or phosphodiesterase